jgi:hypothetical protein
MISILGLLKSHNHDDYHLKILQHECRCDKYKQSDVSTRLRTTASHKPLITWVGHFWRLRRQNWNVSFWQTICLYGLNITRTKTVPQIKLYNVIENGNFRASLVLSMEQLSNCGRFKFIINDIFRLVVILSYYIRSQQFTKKLQYTCIFDVYTLSIPVLSSETSKMADSRKMFIIREQ